MLHKFALCIGAIASAGILIVALASAGSGTAVPVATPLDNAVAQAAAQTPPATTVTDNVYVKPTPKARIIRINKTATVRATQRPVSNAGHEVGDAAEHEDEGSGD